MTMRLIFGAVTKQRNRAAFAERLEEPKSKLLAVVFDRRIPTVDRSAFKQFVSIPAAEDCPSDFAHLEFFEQPFARREIRHPYIVTRLRHPAPPESRR